MSGDSSAAHPSMLQPPITAATTKAAKDENIRAATLASLELFPFNRIVATTDLNGDDGAIEQRQRTITKLFAIASLRRVRV